MTEVLFGSILAEMPQGISVHTHLLCNPRITRADEIIATLQPTYTERAVHEQWPSFKTIKALYRFQDYIQTPRVAGISTTWLCPSQLSSAYLAPSHPRPQLLVQGSAGGHRSHLCLSTANPVPGRPGSSCNYSSGGFSLSLSHSYHSFRSLALCNSHGTTRGRAHSVGFHMVAEAPS